jgi:hypothetical protein
MKTMNTLREQSGAVSIFVVIFAALLITVVTVSFLRIMINDQSQASSNDLSQSAYDSALAGVEDAKRALLWYQESCNTQGKAVCDTLAGQFNTASCNEALSLSGVIAPGSETGNGSQVGEIRVQQSTSSADADLDQAYTCVVMNLETDDYIGNLGANQSKLIPLAAKNMDGSTDFDSVTIEWYSAEDMSGGPSGNYAVTLPTIGNARQLPAQSSWSNNRPSILRTQLMQFGDDFTLENFDAMTGSSESNANTLFLSPTSGVTASSESFTARDTRRTDPNGTTSPASSTTTPLPVQCRTELSQGGYACQLTLTLPQPIGGGERTAYLRLTPFYTASHFRVTLEKSGLASKFNAVQPEIDATGRANDLFRRVVTRVDLIDTSFPYPDAAVDLSGNFCKDFAVTDSAYLAGSCTP